MGTRHELHDELKALLGTTDKTGLDARCYFQPPESIKLKYPCFVYHRVGSGIFRANNGVYHQTPKYGLTYITSDPDDPLIEQTESRFSMCKFLRSYCADDLNHYYYDLFY